MQDALGREWQMGTIQLDYQLPERFDLSYIDNEGKKVRPVMVHRTIYGSLERFIGLLIEQFAGHFPLWISPIQVIVLPVKNEFHLEYANKVKEALHKAGIRVSMDDREEKLGYRIREAQMQKINYQVVLGDQERDNNEVKVRKYGDQEQISYKLDEFINLLLKEIENKDR